ncbi:MAG: hypothetical protein RLZZ142_1485 [Verrucomicrobiota bacterium]
MIARPHGVRGGEGIHEGADLFFGAEAAPGDGCELAEEREVLGEVVEFSGFPWGDVEGEFGGDRGASDACGGGWRMGEENLVVSRLKGRGPCLEKSGAALGGPEKQGGLGRAVFAEFEWDGFSGEGWGGLSLGNANADFCGIARGIARGTDIEGEMGRLQGVRRLGEPFGHLSPKLVLIGGTDIETPAPGFVECAVGDAAGAVEFGHDCGQGIGIEDAFEEGLGSGQGFTAGQPAGGRKALPDFLGLFRRGGECEGGEAPCEGRGPEGIGGQSGMG